MTIEQQAFILRLAERLPSSLKENTIGVGWAEAKELDKAHEWEQFKRIVRAAYPQYYSSSERALGNASGSLWRFIHEMKVGDIVVVPVAEGFYIAEVKSDVNYDEAHRQDDYAWRRGVVWLTRTPIPRSHAANALQLRLKSRQTCVDARDLLKEIEAARQRKEPLEFTSVILSSAHDVVAQALLSAINDCGLEKVVRQLVIANGATAAEIPAKNSGKPGDADVIATYDHRVGVHHSVPVRIAYQVKQHQGMTDEWGIQQLIERMEHDESIVCGCLVTTATDISPKAKELLEAHEEIMLVAQKELVEWVLKTGLSALNNADNASTQRAA
jgi:predicted Mrr-cat superfamily restriction endonuclease